MEVALSCVRTQRAVINVIVTMATKCWMSLPVVTSMTVRLESTKVNKTAQTTSEATTVLVWKALNLLRMGFHAMMLMSAKAKVMIVNMNVSINQGHTRARVHQCAVVAFITRYC